MFRKCVSLRAFRAANPTAALTARLGRPLATPFSTANLVKSDASEGESSEQVPWIDQLEIRPEGRDPLAVQLALDVFLGVMKNRSNSFLGYQVNADLPDVDALMPAMEMHLNNAGDPFIKSAFGVNAKVMERAVLRFCAQQWFDDVRDEDDPNADDNFWGYVLNMGSTEGNLNALWNAREYMDMRVTKEDQGAPLVLLSQDAHYSLPKAAGVLRMETATVPTDQYSRVLVDELLDKVRETVAANRPPVVVLNMGTTFAGAYDDHRIVTRIHAIANKKGLASWVHMDGALGGFIAPLLGDVKDMPDEQEYRPKFGFIGDKEFSLTDVEGDEFTYNGVQSVNASFYKWYGAPYPTGIFMTQNKYLRKADTPDYIGSPDTTLGGGRNAFSGLYMWYILSLTDLESEKASAKDCLQDARYLLREMEAIDAELVDKFGSEKKADKRVGLLKALRSPYSFAVTFNSPSKALTDKYSVPQEYSDAFDGNRSHIYTMKHVDRDLVDAFLQELRADKEL